MAVARLHVRRPLPLPMSPDGSVARAAVRVVRYAGVQLLLSLGLLYASILLASIVTSNLGRGLVELEAHLFASGEVTLWLGMLAYAQGVVLLVAAMVAPIGAFLVAATEMTRSAIHGRRSSTWRVMLGSAGRGPAVGIGLVRASIHLVLTGALAALLLVLSVVTVPVALVVAATWLVRPRWRRSWLLRPLVVAAPFGVLVDRVVRWSLWLPYVVDGTRPRAGLRASRAAVSGRWAETAKPFVAVAALATTVAGVGAAIGRDGGPALVSTAGHLLALLTLMIGSTIVATVLHERYDVTPPRPDSPTVTRSLRIRRVGIALVIGLAAQGLAFATAPPAAAAAITVEVNSIEDAATPGVSECLTPEAVCTLRAAIDLAIAAPDPATTIGFSVSGTIELVETLWIPTAMVIDGDGERITIANGGVGRLVQVGGGFGEETPVESSVPLELVLRNLTFSGARSGDGAGLLVATGDVLVDRSTFIDNITSGTDTLGGGAILNAGTLEVRNTTFSGNLGLADQPQGGAVLNWWDLTVVNSTFVNGHGVGSISGSGTTKVWNSVFKGVTGAFNCAGDDLTGGGNVSNDGTCPAETGMTSVTALDLALGALGDNGGFVDTVALGPASIAVGAGDAAECPDTDARGAARPSECDAGAYQTEGGVSIDVTSGGPTHFGDPLRITVTVSHSEATPTGTVTVAGLPGDPREATLASGMATYDVTDVLAVGDHELTIGYEPAGGLDAASVDHVHEVVKQQSTTVLTVTPAERSGAGETITLDVTVTNRNNADGADPTGSVELFDGDDSLGVDTLDEDGLASLDVTLDPGLHVLTAVYGGSAGFEAHTSPEIEHVVQADTTVVLAAPASSVYGVPFDVTVTVAGADGLPTPTGLVSVFHGTGSSLVSASLDEAGTLEATVTYPTVGHIVPAGDNTFWATYVGDDHNAASASDPVDHEVTTADTTTSLRGPASTTTFGADAAFVATVDGTGTTATPTGSVSFDVDGADSTVALVDGSATLTTATLGATVGLDPHEVTATYVPDHAGFAASASSTVEHPVSKSTTALTLTGPATSVTGQSVALVATVTSSPAPSGTITFTSGTTTVGTATLVAGVASLTVTSLAQGSHSITATFAGGADHTAVTSSAFAHGVSKASTAVVLTSSPDSPAFGQTVTLHATVAAAAPGGGVPAGFVQLLEGDLLLGTAAIDSSGEATLNIADLSVGTHSITASFGGTATFLASTGDADVTVEAASVTVGLTTSETAATYGVPVTLTATVTSATGSEPSGTVVFSWLGNDVGGAPLVDGVATLTSSSLAPVPCTLSCISQSPRATYGGDDSHSSAAISELPEAQRLLVSKGVYALNVTTDVASSTFGDVVRITADTGGPVGGRVPSANVEILAVGHGSRTIAFDEDGSATWDVSDMPAGTRNIIATAFSDSYFTQQTATIQHEVSRANATIDLVTTPDPPKVGEAFTLTAEVAPAATASSGIVAFYEGDVFLGSAAVDGGSKASISPTLATRGLHTITAIFNGGSQFHVTQVIEAIDVLGRPVTLHSGSSVTTYGDRIVLDAAITSLNLTAPMPTGTVTATIDGVERSSANVASTLLPGAAWAPVKLWLGDLDAGTHEVALSYSGDAVHQPTTARVFSFVQPRSTTTGISSISPSSPRVGEPVSVRAEVSVGVTTPKAPSGRITITGDGSTCTVDLTDGRRGGACDLIFTTAGRFGITASYAGDDRFVASRSQAAVNVVRGEAFVDVTATYRNLNGEGVWLDEEPVTVSWNVRGIGTTEPTGGVEVRVEPPADGSCTSAPTGSCELDLRAGETTATIEVRFLGDAALTPAVGRVSGQVRTCHVISVLGAGRVATAPSCNGTKFISGTEIDLEATVPAGYELKGWGFGRAERGITQSPLRVVANEILTPRWDPLCGRLVLRVTPEAPLPSPSPAPNCDDPVSADYRVIDLQAVRSAEVSAGSMRYRVGTVVTLPTLRTTVPLGPSGEILDMVWDSDDTSAVKTGASGRTTVTVDGEHVVRGSFGSPACRRFDVVGPPGLVTRVARSRLELSLPSDLLGRYLPTGQCQSRDGTPGYLTGTSVTVDVTAPEGDWFDRFGDIVPLGRLTPPAGPEARLTRPSTVPSTTATFVVPPSDAGVIAHTATMRCVELKVTIRDAVEPWQLAEGTTGPTVATTPDPNCPSDWLNANGIVRPRADQPQPRWFVAGTDVTLRASTSERRAYVEEFDAERPISFRQWSGDVTDVAPVTTVRLVETTTVTAEWHVGALCVRVNVRGLPADGGEVLTTGLDATCPPFESAGGTLLQARLGTTLNLAARAFGQLVPIWQVQGESTSSSTGCRQRTAEVEVRRARLRAEGLTSAQVDERLMELGYEPGWVLLQIERVANGLFSKGVPQAQVIEDVRLRGLVLPSGAPVGDDLLANPCTALRRDTVLPPGQPVISFDVDGDTTATAWFCKPVIPSVVVYDHDGGRHDIPADGIDEYAVLFLTRNADGVSADCPVRGHYLYGTRPIFGDSGGVVAGHEIESWSVDGTLSTTPQVSLPITLDGAPPEVEVTLRVRCHPLTVTARNGYYTDPKPNCPFADPKRNLYIEGTKVVVGAAPSDMYVWQGWGDELGMFNPVVVEMTKPTNLTGSFREKTIGEGIQTVVVDPLVDGLGVGAKKVVGGIAFMTKIAAAVLENALLRNLRIGGELLGYGLRKIGLGGAVVDGIVLGITQPHKSVSGMADSLDCVTIWALGSTAPTPGQLAGVAMEASMPSLDEAISTEEMIGDAQAIAARARAGDPEAIAQLTVSAYGAGPLYAMAKDMYENPDAWIGGAAEIGVRARSIMDDKFKTSNGLTWESSASEAWTTGGQELAECMADSGRTMAGQ